MADMNERPMFGREKDAANVQDWIYRRGREGFVDDDTPFGKALSRKTPLRMLIAGTNSSA